MEITGLSPYLAGQVSADFENQPAASQETSEAPESSPAMTTSAQDRVELVRTQNLASPPPKTLDLKKAVLLLRQITHQLDVMTRQDIRQLYQLDRLRELCCRLQEAGEG